MNRLNSSTYSLNMVGFGAASPPPSNSFVPLCERKALAQWYKRICFGEITSLTPTQKLHDIRTFSGRPNDWPSTYADSALLDIIAREIAFSRYLMDACARYTMRYFDTSQDFAATLDQVVAYIRAEKQS